MMNVTIYFGTIPENINLPLDATVAQLTNAVCKRTGLLSKQLKITRELDAEEALDKSGKLEHKSFYAKRIDLPGLDCLGPFAIEPDLRLEFELEVSENSNSYIDMIGPQDYVKKLYEVTGQKKNSFQISPRHKVTLPDNAREEASIPLGNNVYFCWIYPFVKTKHATPEKIKGLDISDKHIALMLYGGYLYLDERNKVLRVNGIKRGHGLYFDGPYVMNSKCYDYVFKQGRFQDITIDLEQCDAFCWFLPDEHISIKQSIGVSPFTDGKGREIPITHGAFGYRCKSGYGRIFRISENVPENSSLPKQSFPSLRKRRMSMAVK